MTSGSSVPGSCKAVGIESDVAKYLSQRANFQRGIAVDRHGGPSIRLTQHVVTTSYTYHHEALLLQEAHHLLARRARQFYHLLTG